MHPKQLLEQAAKLYIVASSLKKYPYVIEMSEEESEQLRNAILCIKDIAKELQKGAVNMGDIPNDSCGAL